LSIAEVQEGQTPAEAILYNTPVYTRGYLRAPYENYPSTYSALVPGKTYAWQVTARNGVSYAAATEAWTFSIGKDSAKQQANTGAYILLRTSTDNGSGLSEVAGQTVSIKYYSFDKTHEASIRFFSMDQKMIMEKKQTITYGENYLDISLKDNFNHGQVYRVEITDQKNNKHTAVFRVK
ncbi:MAG TPA: hypothetical protein VK644_05270, partial [Chitinophagaceae bacterium]|nr:hypothetical protein [Chitinophagaceae bacterium]